MVGLLHGQRLRDAPSTSTTPSAIAALIDISPLFKYRVTGRDATKFVNRVISRDIIRWRLDQDLLLLVRSGRKVIDDGTITRLGENEYRWTAADPVCRWFQQNTLGLT